jgi:hypothetical protein
MESKHKITADHRIIRQWFEERGGLPASVRGRRIPREDGGVLRIYFENKLPEDYIPVSWDEFFTLFDQSHLALMYEDEIMEGKKSLFFKFVSSDGE